MRKLLNNLKKMPLIALMGAIPVGPWLCADGISSLAARWSNVPPATAACEAEPRLCTAVDPGSSTVKRIPFLTHAPLA